MRQPKTFLLLSVVTAVLLLAVAYAAINNISFNVTGNATAVGDASNFGLNFGYFWNYGEGTVTCDYSGQTANFNVTGLTTKGQSAIVELEIASVSKDLYAFLSAPKITNSNPEYFSVSTEGIEGTVVYPSNHEQIRIIITLIKTPIDEVSTNIKVTFDAVPGYLDDNSGGNTIWPS